MKNISILVIIVFVTIVKTLAQDAPEFGCTLSHDRAYRSVKFFLTSNWENIKQHRIKSGTDNIPVEQIRHLDNIEECIELNSIINSVEKYRNVRKAYTEKDHTMFFYQTDDFYYVFWRYINPNEVKITGPKEIFIIVNKHTQATYTCYI